MIIIGDTMKNKGFTLIELLAVIVILAVIALIAVPIILNVIESAKKGAIKDSAYGIIESANVYVANNLKDGLKNTINFKCEKNKCVGENNEQIDYKGKIEAGTLIITPSNKVLVCVDDGEYYALKLEDQEKVTNGKGTCGSYEEENGAFEIIEANGGSRSNYALQFHVGDKVSYADINWYIISIDDKAKTATLVTTDNYKTGAFDENGSNIFEGSTVFDEINNTFISENEYIQKAIKDGAMKEVGRYKNKPYYARLLKKEELSEITKNNSDTPFWTMTSEGENIYFGDSQGELGVEYYANDVTYYSWYSTSSIAVALKTDLGIKNTDLNPNTTNVDSEYTTTTGYYSTSYSSVNTGSNNYANFNYCHPTSGVLNAHGSWAPNWTLYYALQATCEERTIYELINKEIGIRPVIIVKMR